MVAFIISAFWSSSNFLHPGRKIHDLIELFDICPTILDLAKIVPPDWMEAKSLIPLLEGRLDAKGRDYVFSEHARDTYLPNTRFMTMIRNNEWKLIIFLNDEDEEGQLFNLIEDPHELKDLWKNAEFDEKKKELQNVMHTWLSNSLVKTHSWKGRSRD